jgi:hypothetical protein
MPLSSLFSDEEVEYVREISRLANTTSNTAMMVGKLDALNSAQVIAVQRDIEQWKRIEYGTEKSKGGIKGTDYDTERNRQYIRNKMRERLDLPALPDPIGADSIGFFGVNLPGWFGTASDEFSQD